MWIRKRPGGRASQSLRPMSVEWSPLQNADGSAEFRSGSTHVLACVYGPVEPRMVDHMHAFVARVSVLIKPPTSSSLATSSSPSLLSLHTAEWENLLTGVFTNAIMIQRFPRTVIQIVIHILTLDGSVLATILHAAVSALMDAHIDLHYIPTAVTCLILPPTPAPAAAPATATAAATAPAPATATATTFTTATATATATATTSTTTIWLDPNRDEENIDRDAGIIVLVIAPPLTSESPDAAVVDELTEIAVAKNNNNNDHNDNDVEEEPLILAMHTSNLYYCGTPSHASTWLLLQCATLASRTRPALLAFWRVAMQQKVHKEANTLWSSMMKTNLTH